MKFDLKNLLIPGNLVGDDPNSCYVAIFRAGQYKGSNEWIFGSVLFSQYYVVFDMTPHNERAENFAYVGFAIKNP